MPMRPRLPGMAQQRRLSRGSMASGAGSGESRTFTKCAGVGTQPEEESWPNDCCSKRVALGRKSAPKQFGQYGEHMAISARVVLRRQESGWRPVGAMLSGEMVEKEVLAINQEQRIWVVKL